MGSFIVTDPSQQAHFETWVERFPRSYAARLSRGIFYFKSGVQTRGNKFISRTTAEQIRGMRAYFDLAGKDLEDSLALDPKPMLSYNYLIRISMHVSTADNTRGLLDAALKLDPVALLARRPYLNSLEKRWGGDLDQMLDFMQQSRNAGLNESQMAILQKVVDEERDWLKKHESGAEQPAMDGGG